MIWGSFFLWGGGGGHVELQGFKGIQGVLGCGVWARFGSFGCWCLGRFG